MKTVALVLASVVGVAIGGCSSNPTPDTTPDAAYGEDSGPGTQQDSGQQSSGQDSSTQGGQDSSITTGGNDSSTLTDSSTITDSQTGNPDWVDMDFADGAANGHACDDHPGVPCGWSATNTGAGYTCKCVFPADLDPWGCSAPDSGAPLTCPAPDAGGD
jgi:hypothetical protein